MDAHELQEFQEHREKKRARIFQKILDRCLQHVKLAAEHNKTEQVYRVPVFLLGKPLYKLEACLCYLIVNLKKKGYQVNYYLPNVLHISWKNGLTFDEKYFKYLQENTQGIIKH